CARDLLGLTFDFW
nr:immunoglobulin heavy chain junction region [Macaca mulatta]MOW77738.1 immunoglobulin heavy chain junction region [Macaca mulatta]MOW81322.1 immunoglobulin heavy chain junction region [Macaca mulatta]MOW83471.1 immunoglobulin heavy chain junction region [Macaca mulatta]